MRWNQKFFARPAVTSTVLGLVFFVIIVSLATQALPPRTRSADATKLKSARAPVALRDETLARGIRFRHMQLSDRIQGLDDALGSGACVFDLDNDNDLDLFLVGGSGQQRYYGKDAWWSKRNTSHLYRNDGAGYFEEITEGSGLDIEFWGMGCNAADFDQDGLIDLLLTGREQNRVFRNLGTGRFAGQRLGQTETWSTSAAIGDYNNDGLMDIYVANFLQYDKSAKKFEAASGFEVENPAFIAETSPGTANFLYTNKGGFSFQSEADERGIENSNGRSLAAKWLDANLDRWPDLLVLNASGSASRLFLNEGGEAFEPAKLEQSLGLPNGIRDSAFQDYDRDGDADLILSTSLGENFAVMDNVGEAFRNLAWQEHSSSGDFSSFSGFGIDFVDLNNDGHLDIFHGQGLLHPDPDAPAVSAGQPDAISLATGDGDFLPFETVAGTSTRWNLPFSTRAVVTVDIDNDGDRDLVLTSNNNAARLLINRASNPRWIGIDLVDRSGNRGNYYKVVVKTSRQQRSFFMDNDSFLGRHDDRISLSLGNTEDVEEIRILWRDNSETTISNPDINAYLKFHQGSGLVSRYTSATDSAAVILPPRMAIWQYRANRAERRQVVDSIQQATRAHQLELMQAIATYKHPEKLLSFLFTALASDDDEIVIAAIKALEALELEDSYYWMAPLFLSGSDDVKCTLANTFRHFFIEEEAVIHRKYLAIPQLVHLLAHSSAKVKVCALYALAESKSVRAVAPIEKLLQQSDDTDLLVAALYALGELRRGSSAKVILSQIDDSPKLAIAKQAALFKLNAIRAQSTSTRVRVEPAALAACPSISSTELPVRADESMAAEFAACKPLAMARWFESHRAYIMRNSTFFFESLTLDETGFKSLVGAIAADNSSAAANLLLLRLQKTDSLTEKKLIIAALKQLMPSTAIEKVLRLMMSDQKAARPLRIAIGDVLIDHDAEFVLKLGLELFDDAYLTQ